MKNEAYARIKINQLLTEAGWRFFDNEQGKANILPESHVKITQREMDAWGKDYEKTKNGSLDFLLVDTGNKPLCVLEAKKESLHPLVAKEQARKYAKTAGARYVILFLLQAGVTTRLRKKGLSDQRLRGSFVQPRSSSNISEYPANISDRLTAQK